MKNTVNYGLNKPDLEDFYNINDFNENMDIIDAELFALQSAGVGEEIKNLIGNTGDTGATDNSGTVMGKENLIIQQASGIDMRVQDIQSKMTGQTTPYGNGLLGDVEFNSSSFVWGNLDVYNRYVLQVKSLHIPTGQTMIPPEKCDGVYIFSQGDVVIDGAISVVQKRLSIQNIKLLPYVQVNGVKYDLAKGGDSMKGGNAGKSGIIYVYDRDIYAWSMRYDGLTTSVKSKTVAGDVAGGGFGCYATGASSYDIYDSDDDYAESMSRRKSGSSSNRVNAPCALIIIAKGNVILNGSIIATGTSGSNATSGGDSTSKKVGGGGDGFKPPSGGAPITLICKAFKIGENGKINNAGKTINSPNGSDGSTEETGYSYTTQWKFEGGKGGSGGTATSTADCISSN